MEKELDTTPKKDGNIKISRNIPKSICLILQTSHCSTPRFYRLTNAGPPTAGQNKAEFWSTQQVQITNTAQPRNSYKAYD